MADREGVDVNEVMRFAAKVRRDHSGCWEWTGNRRSNGYGKFYYQGRVISAHRAAFHLAHGYFPDVVMHSCDNPPCVNPDHLRAGTQAVNAADMVSKGRSTRGERNPSALLTPDTVRDIRARVAGGESQRAVARALGINFRTVNVIMRRKTWRHVL